MCCFSKSVSRVRQTRIFARSAGGAGQFLAYQMTYSASFELAMILPLPTPPAVGENAVRFIDLSGYPKFFEDAERAFANAVRDPDEHMTLSARKLEVQSVGSYEASFVPRQADFARLDERFRLPQDVWAALPGYADWSFAVFKLKSGAHEVHPMAFEFPRRDPDRLFFPTLHIHGMAVYDKASFDHMLYCQRDAAPEGWSTSLVVPDSWHQWQRNDDASKKPTAYDERVRIFTALMEGRPAAAAREFIAAERAQGLIDAERPLYRQFVHGLLPNTDHYI
jgi:hypothetical protein